MTERLRPSRRRGPLPVPLRWSITAWLTAVALGVTETLVHLVLPSALLIVGLRAAHLLAVLIALIAMFRPRVNAYFRAPTASMSAA